MEMYSTKTDSYLASFNEDGMERAIKLLNLEMDVIRNSRVRDPYTWNYIRYAYDENYLTTPKLVKLIPFEEGKFSLKTNASLKHCNIFFNLYVSLPKANNVVIQLKIENICIIQSSLKGSEIFCRGLRETIEGGRFVPIYLFEQLDKKFLDIWDIPHFKEIDVVLECSEPVELMCEVVKYPNPRVVYRHIPPLVEEYCLTETIKRLTPSEKDGAKYVFEFNSRRLSPLFYISFFKEDTRPLSIKWIQIRLSKANYVIDFYNPKIIFRYKPNFHLIYLFQSNNVDFMRESEAPLGINLALVASPIRVEIEADEDNNLISAEVGIFEFSVISYQGACRAIF